MDNAQASQLVSDICEYYELDEIHHTYSIISPSWVFYCTISGFTNQGYILIDVMKHTTLNESQVIVSHNTANRDEVKEMIETFAQGEYSLE